MPPSRPHLVLFDFDGVLADYSRQRRVAALATATGTEPERVRAALFTSGLEAAYDAGAVDTPGYLRRLGGALGADVDAATWIAVRVAGTRARAGALALLRETARHVAVAILTNNGPLIADVIPAVAPSLFPLLRGRVLCSGALGRRKPDPDVYRRALARLDGDPARTLFVDDLFVNVQGARRAGLQADTARDARSLRNVLRRHRLPVA